MKSGWAPDQLPFAPRPLAGELVSSWLLRVAAANYVSLRELLLGFQIRNLTVPCPALLDLGLPPTFLKAMARFCRVTASRLQSLDLRSRLPHVGRALFLSFSPVSKQCLRLSERRIGYAFCAACLKQQHFVHVRWDWTFPCLLRCRVHNTALEIGCHSCGELDPLPFGAVPATQPILCSSCRAGLTNDAAASRTGGSLNVVAKAYRTALLQASINPVLLGPTTGIQFRHFVDDMLQLFSNYPRPPRFSEPLTLQYLESCRAPAAMAIQERLTTISKLICNASESSSNAGPSRRHENLSLWASMLCLLSNRDGEILERRISLWPKALQQDFASALLWHTHQRWPDPPFSGRSFRPEI